MSSFTLESPFAPCGDQPAAIEELVAGIADGRGCQVLLGATGTGKTFTLANVIAHYDRPALVMAPNKTLAAQLCSEFREIFPNNAVEYFVSYYDYYQPEAYLPASDTYIAKDSSINETIDRMRHAATRSLFERDDVIIVASVSCIYGLGSSEAYYGMLAFFEVGKPTTRRAALKRLVAIQYERRDLDFYRGSFRVRGDVVEIFPAHEDKRAIRMEFFGDEIESIHEIDPITGSRLARLTKIAIYPNTHYVILPERKKRAIDSIATELNHRLTELAHQGKEMEALRLDRRTRYDLEMMASMGYCNGVENYSRHLSGREAGEAPPCLIDYFPDDFLMIVDESHVTIPQIGGMYRGDRARKLTLIDHGFRLPSALDNRPLKFEEWTASYKLAILASATPGDYELDQVEGIVTEQINRPTGLIDPTVVIAPATNQVDHLYGEIRKCVDNKGRVLVTTLTKRMAEDLTEYLEDLDTRVRYLHSDIDTLERVQIIEALRRGEFDVLVGINLLREGLDIPEVQLVGILDADKEGFLRSARSLIQTIGRAARNINGRVVLYADRITPSIEQAIEETERRRTIQEAFNRDHNIVPRSVVKAILPLRDTTDPSETRAMHLEATTVEGGEELLSTLRDNMREAARDLRFEEAARIRDRIREIEAALITPG
jgi:excinuclease ABC subunit B